MQKNKQPFKVFITKYVMALGIIEAQATDCFDISPDMITVIDGTTASRNMHKGEWFYTREEAKIEAEKIRRKKIHLLHKQIEHYEKKIF
jgi:hypothetical protein